MQYLLKMYLVKLYPNITIWIYSLFIIIFLTFSLKSKVFGYALIMQTFVIKNYANKVQWVKICMSAVAINRKSYYEIGMNIVMLNCVQVFLYFIHYQILEYFPLFCNNILIPRNNSSKIFLIGINKTLLFWIK